MTVQPAPPAKPPIDWPVLVTGALIAACVVALLFWIGFFIVGAIGELLAAPKPATVVQRPYGHLESALVLVGGIAAIILYYVVSCVFAFAVGLPAAITIYTRLRALDRLSLRLLVAGAAMAALGTAHFALPLMPVSGLHNLLISLTALIAGAVGGLIFGRRMQRIDARRGYVW